MQARRCSLRLQSRHRSGAGPTWSGWSSTLTWRGFVIAQRTGTATADAGSIHHAQASIGFSAPFMREQVLASRTLERAIGLKRKVGSGETPRFPRRVAVVGGPYPETGADEGGYLAVCW